VQAELKWMLSRYNAKWGAEGKISLPGPKVDCSVEDFVRLIGKAKALPASDFSVIRVLPPRVQCPSCSKVFGSQSAWTNHNNSVHATKQSSSATKTTSRKRSVYCDICDKYFSPNTFDLQRHIASKRHQTAMKLAGEDEEIPEETLSKNQKKQLSYCKLCNVFCGTVEGLQQHRAKRHPTANATPSSSGSKRDSGTSSSSNSTKPRPKIFRCELCDRILNSEKQKAEHDASLGHLMRDKEASDASHGDVSVEVEINSVRKSSNAHFTVHQVPTTSGKVTITNLRAATCFIDSVFVIPPSESVTVARFTNSPMELKGGFTLTVPVGLQTSSIGTQHFRVVVRLKSGDKILPVSVDVVDDVVQSLASSRPYVRRDVPVDVESELEIIDGEKPSGYATFEIL
jgi:uncharacterized C2H2 Zn-finger protein